MKLKEYVAYLNDILEKYEDEGADDFEVVTTIGYQSFSVIDYVPAVGVLSDVYEGIQDNWFDPEDEENTDEELNAVLVN